MIETTDCSSFVDSDKGCGKDNGVGDTFIIQRSANKVIDRSEIISCFLTILSLLMVYCLLIIFASRNGWPDLAPNCLNLLVFLEVLRKKILRQQKHEHLPSITLVNV